MFKLASIAVGAIVYGFVAYALLAFRFLPQCESFLDVIYVVSITFSMFGVMLTTTALGVSKIEEKNVHYKSRSSKLATRSSRILG
jgi:uncharacterized protein with PQ loop repeat